MEQSAMKQPTMKPITYQIATDETGWDEGGEYGDIQLYGAKLAIDTPKLKKGTRVDCIIFMFSRSLCQITEPIGEKDANGWCAIRVIDEFPLTLSIG